MKYLLLAIAVPDCYTTALVFRKESNKLNRRLQAETDKALANLLLYDDPKGKEGKT